MTARKRAHNGNSGGLMKKRSNEKRATFRAFTSIAFGEIIKKTSRQKSLRKLVNINERSISKAIKMRESILKGDLASWLHIKGKFAKMPFQKKTAK